MEFFLGPTFALYSIYISSPLCGEFFLGPTFALYSIYISSPLCGEFFLGPTFALYIIYISSPLFISSVFTVYFITSFVTNIVLFCSVIAILALY